MTQIVNNRRLGRELVLQALYAYEFTGATTSKLLDDLKRYYIIESEIEEYLLNLLTLTIEHKELTINETVIRLQNWEYERVALIDRLILQMMITEMVYIDEVPPKVSITEGVEIAKKYSTDDSSSFVNGILDSVYHSLEQKSS